MSQYYKSHCGAQGCAIDQGAALADHVRHATYKDLDSFQVALAEVGEKAQLNMAKNWRAITADVFANGQCCTCQTGVVRCPCVAGLAAAKQGGDCYCGLFFGHDHAEE